MSMAVRIRVDKETLFGQAWRERSKEKTIGVAEEMQPAGELSAMIMSNMPEYEQGREPRTFVPSSMSGAIPS